MKKRSLRTELILWSVGILLFYMVSQVCFIYFFAQNIALNQKEEKISQLMAHLKDNYTDNPMEIYALVEKYQTVDNLRVMIYGENKLIYHSSSVGQAPDRSNFNLFDLPELTEFISGRGLEIYSKNREKLVNPFGQLSLSDEVSNFLFYNELESNVVGMEESFLYQGNPRTIAIWSSTIAIDDTAHLVNSLNIWVSLVVISLTVATVIIFSRRFSRPVEEMERVASALAMLDFSNQAVEESRTLELSSLAQSLNLMSDNLEEMIAQLSQDNRTLSHKVENQEKLDQMRRQFVANISHEMKTPLSMLMMYSENLKLDLPNVDKNFYYDTIIEEAAGLNAMVEQLLDTSAVENGLSQMDLQPMNLSLFVQDILEKASPLLEKFHCQFDITTELYVKGDGKYLEQALRNYLSNAMSHCPEQGGIQVILREISQETLEFAVINQGTPIATEDMPFLWDSFYRGDKSRTQVGGKRVGLGLYIVKTCISSHFGQVFVENLPDKVKFSFQLPRYYPE